MVGFSTRAGLSSDTESEILGSNGEVISTSDSPPVDAVGPVSIMFSEAVFQGGMQGSMGVGPVSIRTALIISIMKVRA